MWKNKAETLVSEQYDVKNIQPAIAALKMKGSHKSSHGQPLEAGKGKETLSSRASRKEYSPANTLILVWKDSFWSPDLQNCKIINV